MARVRIADASVDDLRSFAQSLGCNLGPNQNRKADSLVALIQKSGWSEDYIEILDAPEMRVPTPVKADGELRSPPHQEGLAKATWAVDANGKMEKTMWIEIANGDGVLGEEDVFLSVNERGITLPRERPIGIPYRYYEALNNAVMEVYDSAKDGGLNEKSRKVRRFNFNVIEAPEGTSN